MGVPVRGCVDVWVCGCVWPRGCPCGHEVVDMAAGAWPRGRVRMWMSGCAVAQIPASFFFFQNFELRIFIVFIFLVFSFQFGAFSFYF